MGVVAFEVVRVGCTQVTKGRQLELNFSGLISDQSSDSWDVLVWKRFFPNLPNTVVGTCKYSVQLPEFEGHSFRAGINAGLPEWCISTFPKIDDQIIG